MARAPPRTSVCCTGVTGVAAAEWGNMKEILSRWIDHVVGIFIGGMS